MRDRLSTRSGKLAFFLSLVLPLLSALAVAPAAAAGVEEENAAAVEAADPRAAGDYVYLVIAELVGAPTPEDWNNFKLRSDGTLRILPLPFVFTAPLFGAEKGCIVYPDACPNNNLTPTTYDGTWSLLVEQTAPAATIEVFDGDFDRGSWDDADLDDDDAATPSIEPCPGAVPPPYTPGVAPCVPDFAVGTGAVTEGVADGAPGSCGSEASQTGCPADDRSDPVFRRAAAGGGPPRYTVTAPDGETAPRDNPSGNREWERLAFAAVGVAPAVQSFTKPGDASFTVPPRVREVEVETWGGGGGGGGADTGTGSAGGAGGGGGSGFVSGFSTLTLAGGGTTPGNAADPDRGGAGVGGAGGVGATAPTAGSGGRLVVRYGSSAPATFPAGLAAVAVAGVDLSNLNAWKMGGAVCPLDAAGDAICSRCLPALDFADLTPGADLAATQPYADLLAPGVGIRFASDVSYPTIFDTAAPTCGDVDLGAPNECYGGPGVAGGVDPSAPGGPCGSGATNAAPLGHALIVQESSGGGASCTPNDKGGGPNTLILTFDVPVFLDAVDLLDLDENASEIRLYDQFGDLLGPPVTQGGLGDNSYVRETLGFGGVRRLEIALDGSGAVPGLVFCAAGAGGAPLTAELAGTAWTDGDGDGAFEPQLGELGRGGEVIALLAAGAALVAEPVATTVTDPGGGFRFRRLAPGSYLLRLAGEAPSPPFELTAGERRRGVELARTPSDVPAPRTARQWAATAWPTAFVVVGDTPYPRLSLLPLMRRGGFAGRTAGDLVADLVAAKLNVGVGRPHACIEDAVVAADAWLTGLGARRLQLHALRLDADGRALRAALESFNRRGCP